MLGDFLLNDDLQGPDSRGSRKTHGVFVPIVVGTENQLVGLVEIMISYDFFVWFSPNLLEQKKQQPVDFDQFPSNKPCLDLPAFDDTEWSHLDPSDSPIIAG